MKIEIVESLLLPWLRHVKNCQIIQTNWKPSFSSWKLRNEKVLQKLMTDSAFFFREKYDYEIYIKTSSCSQLIQQSEIDVLGIAYEIDDMHIYAISAAYHEGGLNYGSEDDTTIKILNWMLRTAMCIYGYFRQSTGNIIFASPEINKDTLDILQPCIKEASIILRKNGLKYNLQLMANYDFNEKIIQPVLAVTSLTADTSELYMRCLQIADLFVDDKQTEKNAGESKSGAGDIDNVSPIESIDIDGLSRMRIDTLVKSVLIKMFSNNEITPEEVELMQTFHYSRKTFDIQYPLLVKASSGNGQKVPGYWPETVEIYAEKYFICSEWFETPQNNDREYFMNWLENKKSKPGN